MLALNNNHTAIFPSPGSREYKFSKNISKSTLANDVIKVICTKIPDTTSNKIRVALLKVADQIIETLKSDRRNELVLAFSNSGNLRAFIGYERRHQHIELLSGVGAIVSKAESDIRRIKQRTIDYFMDESKKLNPAPENLQEFQNALCIVGDLIDATSVSKSSSLFEREINGIVSFDGLMQYLTRFRDDDDVNDYVEGDTDELPMCLIPFANSDRRPSPSVSVRRQSSLSAVEEDLMSPPEEPPPPMRRRSSAAKPIYESWQDSSLPLDHPRNQSPVGRSRHDRFMGDKPPTLTPRNNAIKIWKTDIARRVMDRVCDELLFPTRDKYTLVIIKAGCKSAIGQTRHWETAKRYFIDEYVDRINESSEPEELGKIINESFDQLAEPIGALLDGEADKVQYQQSGYEDSPYFSINRGESGGSSDDGSRERSIRSKWNHVAFDQICDKLEQKLSKVLNKENVDFKPNWRDAIKPNESPSGEGATETEGQRIAVDIRDLFETEYNGSNYSDVMLFSIFDNSSDTSFNQLRLYLQNEAITFANNPEQPSDYFYQAVSLDE